jgi:hypothetical protein
VFGNRVLRETFAARTDGVIGEWRTLHIEELNDLYCSSHIIIIIIIHHPANMQFGHLLARSSSLFNGLSWFLLPFGL